VNSSQHLVVKPPGAVLTITTVALQPLAHVNHIYLKLEDPFGKGYTMVRPQELMKRDQHGRVSKHGYNPMKQWSASE
jgi:hypothetical protein